MNPPLLSITELRARIHEGPLSARLRAQIEDLQRREASNGKPFHELRLRDAGGMLVLRAWQDAPAFDACERARKGDAVEITGEFFLNGTFGPDTRRWELRALDAEEISALFGSGNEDADENFEAVRALIEKVGDPRLQALCQEFLREFGARFARAAAARANHHARRGGLLEHTRRMMEAVRALCDAYPELNRDLLLTGALLHDCGKLWETCPPERGFEIPRELRGELLGHITIGIEVANTLWRNLPLEDWRDLAPPSETVRLHLLHLIASHHGELQFGSPVTPRTPEAFALHAIDKLDATLNMLASGQDQTEIAPGIFDRVRALGIHPVAPLPKFAAP